MFINISKGNPVYVNIELILTIEKSENGNTQIFFTGQEFSYTEYSVEEIMKMIEEKLAQKPN